MLTDNNSLVICKHVVRHPFLVSSAWLLVFGLPLQYGNRTHIGTYRCKIGTCLLKEAQTSTSKLAIKLGRVTVAVVASLVATATLV